MMYDRSAAGVTQLVECNLAKVDVAGSNPVSRSKKRSADLNSTTIESCGLALGQVRTTSSHERTADRLAAPERSWVIPAFTV